MPDFCLVGPIKSGTSDLAVSLMLHPNVLTPLAKEFSGSDPEGWRYFYPTEKEKRRHVERHGVALAPYFTVHLSRVEQAICTLARIRPGMKIIIALRNPVERMYSQWKWEVFLTGKRMASAPQFLGSFSAYVGAALDAYPEFEIYTACGFPALQTSIYWKAVAYWIKCFGSENVFVLDVGEYFKNRDPTMRKIQEFLGLPYKHTCSYVSRVNENPIQFPPADPESILKLRDFFRPYNDKLWNVIAEKYEW